MILQYCTVLQGQLKVHGGFPLWNHTLVIK